MQCYLPKITCEEKARLLRRHAAAESDYYRAIHVLSAALGSLEKPDGNELRDFGESARRIMEKAQEELERHTREHGC
jgi:hypothetical protein